MNGQEECRIHIKLRESQNNNKEIFTLKRIKKLITAKKNGCIAISKRLRDAHVDEGNAAHVSASLAVAFDRHAAAMGSNVVSNCIETGKTPRNPSARFRRPLGS